MSLPKGITKSKFITNNKSIDFVDGFDSLAFKTELIGLSQNQINYLNQSCGIARKTYNTLLSWVQDNNKNQIKYDFFALKRDFNAIKKESFPYMYEVSKCASNEAMFNFNTAMKNFFSKTRKVKTGFPKFKKKGINDSFRVDNDNFFFYHKSICDKQQQSYLILPNIKELFKLPEDLSQLFNDNAKLIKVMNITISKKANRFFISVSYQIDKNFEVKNKKIILKVKLNKINAVGIDLGIKDFFSAVDSKDNQFKVASLKTLKSYNDKINFYQRKFAKAKFTEDENGNKIYSKMKLKWFNKLKKIYFKIKNIKQDFLHKITTDLAKKYKNIFIEDLAVTNMLKNRKLSRVIQESCFNQFKNMLIYKTAKFGSNLIVIDRFFPSSKLCSNCNHKNTQLTLKDREWECNLCHTKHDRDYNAAKNILNYTNGYSV